MLAVLISAYDNCDLLPSPNDLAFSLISKCNIRLQLTVCGTEGSSRGRGVYLGAQLAILLRHTVMEAVIR